MRRLVATIVIAIGAAACDLLDTGQPVTLGIINDTNLEVAVRVNGAPIATVEPEGGVTQDAGLPPKPWLVEVVTAAGRVLATLRVAPGDVTSTTHPDGSTEQNGRLEVRELPCGRVIIWAGTFPPSLPAPAPGPVIPCEP